MSNLWGPMIPLIVGSAGAGAIQIVMTILLLRSPGGVRTAGAWVAGMTATRLVQGLLFGLIFNSSRSGRQRRQRVEPGGVDDSPGAGCAVLRDCAQAVPQTRRPDVPPKWMSMTASLTPGKAFLIGAGLLAIGAKFWVFTLGAVGVISDVDLGRSSSILNFLLFVVLAESVHLLLLGIVLAAPKKASSVLDRSSSWLEAHNRVIMTTLGFGTWFMIKALSGLGVI